MEWDRELHHPTRQHKLEHCSVEDVPPEAIINIQFRGTYCLAYKGLVYGCLPAFDGFHVAMAAHGMQCRVVATAMRYPVLVVYVKELQGMEGTNGLLDAAWRSRQREFCVKIN